MNRTQHDIAGLAVDRDEWLTEYVNRHLVKAGLYQRHRGSATDDGAADVPARLPP